MTDFEAIDALLAGAGQESRCRPPKSGAHCAKD